ncbi:hypothetical protein GCM10010493_81340 [Streptomyces lavendulae subsp. grasserius]
MPIFSSLIHSDCVGAEMVVCVRPVRLGQRDDSWVIATEEHEVIRVYLVARLEFAAPCLLPVSPDDRGIAAETILLLIAV